MTDPGPFSALYTFPESFADKPALVTIDGQVVSFERLARTVRSFAGHAAQSGIAAGDRISIEVPNEAVRICLILAMLRIGAVAASGATADEFLSAGVALAGVITQEVGYRTRPRHIAFNQTWFEPIEPEPQGASAKAPDPARPCLVMSSSGSTGSKKFMEFSLKVLAQRLEWDRVTLGDRPQNRLVTLGAGTNFGLREVFRTLEQGCLLLRPGATPPATLELMRNHEINELVTTPITLNDLVNAMEAKRIPLPQLESIITGGGPIAGQLGQRASEVFGVPVTNLYGSTETGLIAATQGSAWFSTEGASGGVMPWIDLQIVDESGKPQPPGNVGEVRIRLDRRFSVAGYLNQSPSEAETIRGGWFYPGDLGTLSASGELTLAGRTRELVNLGGNKISPSAIEDKLRSIRGIEHLAAVALRNRGGYDDVGLALRVSPDTALATIEESIRRRLGRSVTIRIIEMDALPTTEMGKIDRIRLKEIFSAN